MKALLLLLVKLILGERRDRLEAVVRALVVESPRGPRRGESTALTKGPDHNAV